MLSRAEQYFRRNVRLNEYIDDIFSSFPAGKSAERTLSFQYNSDNRLSYSFLQVSISCGRQLGDYFPNQVASTKILVAMVPKVVAAWRVETNKNIWVSG